MVHANTVTRQLKQVNNRAHDRSSRQPGEKPQSAIALVTANMGVSNADKTVPVSYEGRMGRILSTQRRQGTKS